MLKITKNNWFPLKLQWQILVLGLCLMSFVCHGGDFKFTRTALMRVGGNRLTNGDEDTIAKYDLVALNRFFWDDINGDSWGVIKSINPNINIYLYQLGSEINDNYDAKSIEYLNNLGRWDNRRTFPGTNVNQDHPEFFLLDSSDNRIYNIGYPNSWKMDVGLAAYQDYWLDATIYDITNQSWTADGVFVDNCFAVWPNSSWLAAKYSTTSLWVNAMHSFINAITYELNVVGQKTFCNRCYSRTADGYNAFITLDNIINPPDVVLDEGSFAVKWGPSDVQFYPEADWKRQVDVMGAVHNYKIVHQSHCDPVAGGSGTDNYGKPFTYYDVLWYALCSYHLGKNEVDNNSYFAFSGDYNLLPWHDEFDTSKLNLGEAVGSYQINTISGNNIYMREFVRGYVYVNPTANDVTFIGLNETCKQLDHDNFQDDPATIADVNTINLASHRGTILLKNSVDDPFNSFDFASPPAPWSKIGAFANIPTSVVVDPVNSTNNCLYFVDNDTAACWDSLNCAISGGSGGNLIISERFRLTDATITSCRLAQLVMNGTGENPRIEIVNGRMIWYSGSAYIAISPLNSIASNQWYTLTIETYYNNTQVNLSVCDSNNDQIVTTQTQAIAKTDATTINSVNIMPFGAANVTGKNVYIDDFMIIK